MRKNLLLSKKNLLGDKMPDIKTLNLTFDKETFDKMKKLKESFGRITWEQFIVKMLLDDNKNTKITYINNLFSVLMQLFPADSHLIDIIRVTVIHVLIQNPLRKEDLIELLNDFLGSGKAKK